MSDGINIEWCGIETWMEPSQAVIDEIESEWQLHKHHLAVRIVAAPAAESYDMGEGKTVRPLEVELVSLEQIDARRSAQIGGMSDA